MSVSISGPDYAAVGEPLQFTPQFIYYGTEPYSYSWSSTAAAPGADPSYSLTMPETQTITVYLTVADATSQVAYNYKQVTWNGLYNLKIADPESKLPEEELPAESIVYPNPADAEILVGFNHLKGEPLQIIITDNSGRCLRNLNLQPNSNSQRREAIDISTLRPGTYFITLVVGENKTIQRFVKER